MVKSSRMVRSSAVSWLLMTAVMDHYFCNGKSVEKQPYSTRGRRSTNIGSLEFSYFDNKTETQFVDSTNGNSSTSGSLSSSGSSLNPSIANGFWIPLLPSGDSHSWNSRTPYNKFHVKTNSTNFKGEGGRFFRGRVPQTEHVDHGFRQNFTSQSPSDFYGHVPPRPHSKPMISRPEIQLPYSTGQVQKDFHSYDGWASTMNQLIKTPGSVKVGSKSYRVPSEMDNNNFHFDTVPPPNGYYDVMMPNVDNSLSGASNYGIVSGNDYDYSGMPSYSYGKPIHDGVKGMKYGPEANGITDYDYYPTEKGNTFLKDLFNKFLTLIPIGLLLAIVLPSVVVIPARRSLSDLSSGRDSHKVVETYPILDMIDYYGGFESLKVYNCFQHVVCKTVRLGSEDGSNIFQKHLWKFLNWMNETLAKKFEILEIWSNILNNRCEVYKCNNGTGGFGH